MLAITAGLRLGELLALRWREVDLDLAHLQVVATLVNRKVDSGRRHVELAEPKIPRSRPLVQLSGAAVEAFAAGVHAKFVSEMLGHANVCITLDTYSHVIPAMHREAARVMDELLGG